MGGTWQRQRLAADHQISEVLQTGGERARHQRSNNEADTDAISVEASDPQFVQSALLSATVLQQHDRILDRKISNNRRIDCIIQFSSSFSRIGFKSEKFLSEYLVKHRREEVVATVSSKMANFTNHIRRKRLDRKLLLLLNNLEIDAR